MDDLRVCSLKGELETEATVRGRVSKGEMVTPSNFVEGMLQIIRSSKVV